MIEISEEKLVAKIVHFFSKIKVAVIELEPPATLKVGDRIKIVGNPNKNTGKPRINFEQTVQSMQIEHEQVEEVKPGDSVGLKVDQEVKEGCCIFKL